MSFFVFVLVWVSWCIYRFFFCKGGVLWGGGWGGKMRWEEGKTGKNKQFLRVNKFKKWWETVLRSWGCTVCNMYVLC